MQPLSQAFYQYLIKQKQLSPASINNYLSDINHFLQFLSQISKQPNQQQQPNQQSTNQQPAVQPQQITAQTVTQYQNQLLAAAKQSLQTASPASQATYNRRLSSLRRFGDFLIQTQRLTTDPTAHLSSPKPEDFPMTIRQIISQYEQQLKSEKLSNSTIKNYLSDLNQYLLWAQKNIKTTDSKSNSQALN